MVAVVSIVGLLVKKLCAGHRYRYLYSSWFQVAHLKPPQANCPPCELLGVLMNIVIANSDVIVN